MSLDGIDFGLPPLCGQEPPAFSDENSCRAWLALLPLTNVGLAQSQLTLQLNLLNCYALPAQTRLGILELLREPIEFVHEQSLARFAGRPLPLNQSDQTAFDASQALWQALITAYLHCVKTASDNLAETPHSIHLITSRAATFALKALASSYLDACIAGFLTPPTFWPQLHLIFRAAEQLKIARLPVDGCFRHRTTVTSAYVEVLLLAAAIPIELGVRQLQLVAGWAQRWAHKVVVQPQAPVDRRTPALCVDLLSDRPATFRADETGGASVRWLALAELRKSIKKRLILLAQGESPQALQLGKGCEQIQCEALLKKIYQSWCKGGTGHQPAKTGLGQRSRSNVHLLGGLEAIHYHLTGQASVERDSSIYLSALEHEEIATFGRITKRNGEHYSERTDFLLEEWRIVEQHATDLTLERALSPPGKAHVRDQLVGIRVHVDEGFMLGILSWIAMTASRDGLIAKVDLLPGKPEGVTLRMSGSGTGGTSLARGLFQPAVEALGITASLLMPTGWFKAQRIVEVQVPTGQTPGCRLKRLIGRGADFERVDFEWL